MSSRVRVPVLFVLLLAVFASGAGVSWLAGQGVHARIEAGPAGPGPTQSPAGELEQAIDPAQASAAPSASPAPRADALAADETASRGAVRAAGDSREAQVLELVNVERAAVGCQAMRAESRLAAAARLHSADMLQRGYFDHVSPEGSSPGERIAAAGFTGSTWGENIAAGQRDPAAVVQAWMDSPGHRANILNCKFRYLGVGIAQGPSEYGIYWTQTFGG